MGLAKTLVDAMDEQDLSRCADLLEELRALCRTHPEDERLDQVRKLLDTMEEQQE